MVPVKLSLIVVDRVDYDRTDTGSFRSGKTALKRIG
jgi:hypothetical protein